MALLGNIGRAGVGAVAGGAKAAAGAAALGTGAFLRQAASPIPGGAAAMTAGLGIVGAVGSGAMSGFRRGGGKGGAGGTDGGGAGGGAGVEKLQLGIAQLLEVNKKGFADVSIIKNTLIAMQQNAYEEARARLKKVQGPPLPPQLAAANDNTETSERGGFGLPFLGLTALTGIIGAFLNAAAGFGTALSNLKASFIKWKGAIGGWLGEKLVNARTAFGNLFTKLKGWGASINTWIGEKLTNARTSFGTLFTKLKGWGGSISTWVGERLTNARTSFSNFFGKEGTLSKWGTRLKEFATNNKFGNFLKGFGTMFDGLMTKLNARFVALKLDLPEFLKKDPPKVPVKGNPLIDNKPTSRMPKVQSGFGQMNAKANIIAKNPARNPVKGNTFGQKLSGAVKSGAGAVKFGLGALASGTGRGALSAVAAVQNYFMKSKVGKILGFAVRKLGLPVMAGVGLYQVYSAISAHDRGEIDEKERDARIGAVIGGLGGGALFGILGAAAGGAVAGTPAAVIAPLTTLVGGLGGGIAGYFAGEFLGRQAALAMHGEPVVGNMIDMAKTKLGDAFRDSRVGKIWSNFTGMFGGGANAAEGVDPSVMGTVGAGANGISPNLNNAMGASSIAGGAAMSNGGGGTTINNVNNNSYGSGGGGAGSDINLEPVAPANDSNSKRDNYDPFANVPMS